MDLPASTFAARPGTLADAPRMGETAYRAVDLDAERAQEEVRALLAAPLAPSVVVVGLGCPHDGRMVAVLNAAFLRPWFSARLLRGERPHFHNHVRDAETSPFATLDEIGAANAGEGLDLFLAHFAVDEGLSDAEAIRARTLLVSRFAERFAGNRLRQILVETAGWENTVTARNAGFDVVTTFPAWRDQHGVLEREGPHLHRLTLERAMAVQNFHAVRLLQYRPPVFRFTTGAQEILRHAAWGLADAEIATLAGFSAKSVASAWTRILRRATSAKPALFADGRPGGKSKDRRTLLTYLRDYPEELWPYGSA